MKTKERTKTNKQRFVLLVFFLKGLRGGYSFSEVEREQADEMTEKERKTFQKFDKDLPFS